jgi:hypothetical protein
MVCLSAFTKPLCHPYNLSCQFVAMSHYFYGRGEHAIATSQGSLWQDS